MEELLILLVSKDSITDYICNYLLMDGHYIDVAENLETAKIMIQIRKYDLLLISSVFSKEEEMVIFRQLRRLAPSIKINFLFRLLTQNVEEISQQGGLCECSLKFFIKKNLSALIESIQVNKIFENFSPACTLYHDDRRKEIRAAAKIPVKYYFQEIHDKLFQKEMISRGMDLSKEGIKLIVDDSTKILSYVNLNMLLPFSADPVPILGEIKWSREHLRFPWKEVGVKFFSIKNEDLLKISDYINLYSRKSFIH